ncbi:MAG: hypothetical protein KF703_09785, partial [Actinobacteria bacterium]|nr:hypothetical protein [Actinomycetota bacterium]
MNEHDPLQQYFADRAPHVEVPSAGVATIARRGRARRHRRSAVRIGAVVGVLAVGAGIVAEGRSADDRQTVDTQTATTSKLAWTVVDAPQGIGGFGLNAGATTADGSIYQLSTGPASTAQGPEASRRVLYRSTDEVTWTPAELPAGLSPGALAADGDRLYALGTAPAGGGVQVRLATRSGGADWSTADVPLDLVALGRDFPGAVRSSGFQLASARGTTVVAVSVRGELAEASLPEALRAADGGWGV